MGTVWRGLDDVNPMLGDARLYCNSALATVLYVV